MSSDEVNDLTKVKLSEFMASNPASFLDPDEMRSCTTLPTNALKNFVDIAEKKQEVCVILAAGQGSRFVSDYPKVIHPFSADGLENQPLASYAVRAAQGRGIPIIVIVGHEKNRVVSKLKEHIGHNYPALYIIQSRQMGTGHAVYLANQALPSNYTGKIIVTYADNPGVDETLLGQLSEQFNELLKRYDGNCGALILTGSRADAGSGAAAYGRIVRKAKRDGPVVDIVEKKTIVKLRGDGQGKTYGDVSWTANELEDIDEFNSGIVIAKALDYIQVLGEMVASQTKFNPPKYEYYATDFVKGLVEKGIVVEGWKIPTDTIWKLEGANTVEELAELEQKNAIRSKPQ